MGRQGRDGRLGQLPQGDVFRVAVVFALSVPCSVEGLRRSGQGSASGGGLVCSLPLPPPHPPHPQPTLVLAGSPVPFKHMSLVPGLCSAKSTSSSADGQHSELPRMCGVAPALPSPPPSPLWAASPLPRLQRGGEHAGRKGLSVESWKPASAYLLARLGGCRTQSSRIGAPRRATLRASGWGRPGSTGQAGCPWQEDSLMGRGVGNCGGLASGEERATALGVVLSPLIVGISSPAL